MIDSTPHGTGTVWPCLAYDDAQAAIRFLVAAFGFEEKLVVPGDGDGDGDIVHAQLNWPEGGTILLNTTLPADSPVLVKPGHAATYLVTAGDDAGVDAMFDRAVAAGAAVERPPETQSYGGGARVFTVRDPEGNRWSVGNYPGV